MNKGLERGGEKADGQIGIYFCMYMYAMMFTKRNKEVEE